LNFRCYRYRSIRISPLCRQTVRRWLPPGLACPSTGWDSSGGQTGPAGLARPGGSSLGSRLGFPQTIGSTKRLAPANNRLAPADKRLAPANNRLALANKWLAPADKRLAPANNRLAPANNRLAPANNRLALANKRLAPAINWLAAPTGCPHKKTAPFRKRPIMSNVIIDLFDNSLFVC
jgi:hypothetical protein